MKAADTVVGPDEVGDPQELTMRLRVNGDVRQDGHTNNMIFGVRHVVRYLSRFMVLDPGDVINIGTPSGVAFGANDFPYLRAGDVVERSPVAGPPLRDRVWTIPYLARARS